MYYKCERCNYVCKQKIDMKRHLERKKKCKIINASDDRTEIQLYEDSLNSHNLEDGLPLNIKNSESFNKTITCSNCNMVFHNKSNLNKHISKSCKGTASLPSQTTNIQNIGVQNVQNVQNIINININSLRGFDEDWNIDNIPKDLKEKIFLSDNKFTTTLRNILKYNDNLNVILKDEVTGLVYKIKNNDYEPMHVKDILEETMQKIYKHLSLFLMEIKNDNVNNIRVDILDNELMEIEQKYDIYKNNKNISTNINAYLTNIFDEKKNDAIKQFHKIKFEEANNNNIIDYKKYIDDNY